jgi:RNA polymerase sigma factor (sigma-70 family)
MVTRRSYMADPIQMLFSGGAITGFTDGQLLERFVTGRGEEAELAFAGVVARHGSMVLGVCRDLLRNTHDAEDAFQATFLVLARKAGSLRHPDLVGPWLYGVAHRASRQVKDRNGRRRRRESEAAMSGIRLAVDETGREFRLEDLEDVEALHEEIQSLPEKYRTAIVLCDLQGLTHEEAARRLGRPVGTVSARLSRGRERLKGRLSRRGLVLPATVMSTAMATSRASAMPAALVQSTVEVAMTVSAGMTAGVVPASIAALSQGVLKSMFLANLKMISATVLLVGSVACSVVVVAQQSTPPGAKPRDDAVAQEAAKNTPSRAEKDSAKEAPPTEAELIIRSAANLRKVAGGMHAYVESNGRFPAPAIFSADGKPLLSWRVAILPYIGEKSLHAQFKLDEPWDSPHNKALLEKIPKVFAPIATPPKEPYATFYQGFTGKHAFFEGTRGVKISDISGGTVFTLMVVEAEAAVPWTKPEDLLFEPGKALPKLGGQFKDGYVSVTADGCTRFIRRSIDLDILNCLITRNGGEVIEFAKFSETIKP